MKKAVSRLFQLRKALDECEQELGLSNFSEVERAVLFLTSNRIISADQSSEDRREMILTLQQ